MLIFNKKWRSPQESRLATAGGAKNGECELKVFRQVGTGGGEVSGELCEKSFSK